jgi:hypothetical protein
MNKAFGSKQDLAYLMTIALGESPGTPEDERTHGLSTSQGFWIMNGFTIGETLACNTFAAPADLVK